MMGLLQELVAIQREIYLAFAARIGCPTSALMGPNRLN